MNKADSERMSGILQTMGYELAEEGRADAEGGGLKSKKPLKTVKNR